MTLLLKTKIHKMKILVSIFIFFPFYVSGQQCAEILGKSCSLNVGKEYKQYNIARTAYIEVNKQNLCSVVLPPNKDYLIKFCSDPKFKPLKIRLIDKQHNLVIYDNSDHEYTEVTTFSVSDNPVTIMIEISITKNIRNAENFEVESACAGFWIFFKKRE